MAIIPKLISRSKTTPMKIQRSYIINIYKLILNFIWKNRIQKITNKIRIKTNA